MTKDSVCWTFNGTILMLSKIELLGNCIIAVKGMQCFHFQTGFKIG